VTSTRGGPDRADRPRDEPVGSLGVWAWGDEHADDLAGLSTAR